MALLDYGFENYNTYTILKKGNINIYNENYYRGYVLYIKKDCKYLLDDSEKESVNIKYKLKKFKHIRNREIVGEVIVNLGDKKIYGEPIYVKTKNKYKKKWHLW